MGTYVSDEAIYLERIQTLLYAHVVAFLQQNRVYALIEAKYPLQDLKSFGTQTSPSVCEVETQTEWLLEFGAQTDWSDASDSSEDDGLADAVDEDVVVGEDLAVESVAVDE